MKFSVLVPVFNVKSFLRECLDSICAQNLLDFECIIVDDGSTDESGNICDEYQQKYPWLFNVVHKQNEGNLKTRLTAILLAKGEYCIFVDSDDYIASNALQEIENALSLNGAIDVLIYSYQEFESKQLGKKSPKFAPNGFIWIGEEKKNIYQKLMFSNDVTSMWTKAVRRFIFLIDTTDYFPYYGKNMAEDVLHSLHIFTVAKQVSFLDKTLYFYRTNHTSVSRSWQLENVAKKNSIHVYYAILKYLPRWGMNTRDIIGKLNAQCIANAMYILCKVYEACDSWAKRQEVLFYDWLQIIPGEAQKIDEYPAPYSAYHQIYIWLMQKRWLRLHLHFLQKRLFTNIRKIFRSAKKFCAFS